MKQRIQLLRDYMHARKQKSVNTNISKLLHAGKEQEIESLLNSHPEIDLFDLKNINLQELGISTLAGIVSRNSTIKVLDLSCNNIKEEGFKMLKDAFSYNTTLSTLILESSYIGNSEVQVLGQIIANNKTLNTLRLAGNNIGDDELKIFGEALAQNSALKVLDLAYNKITIKGVHQLQPYIEKNLTLSFINLTYNIRGDQDMLYPLQDTRLLSFGGECISDTGNFNKKKGDCQIFSAPIIIYDNPLLNKINLLEDFYKKYGSEKLDQLITLSSYLTRESTNLDHIQALVQVEDLMGFASDNPDLI